MKPRHSDHPFHDTDVLSETTVDQELSQPPLYRVMLLNDDFTPMEFVVDILQQFFDKSMLEATRLMLAIHHTGMAICGVYTHEIAEMKLTQVHQKARQHGHPLQGFMEQN
ncbi:MAG: ATP-dependent Clp protease adapter ClpS [Magnetococcales bacterium]|nr:ATP-dependent Clp protease adapter ClpS [Magnetococcales bacterium]